jgi:hypothetical protein
MDDDLNISAGLAALFAVVKRINTLITNGEWIVPGPGKCWTRWPVSIPC